MATRLIRSYVLDTEVVKPVIFKGIHASWEPVNWSLEKWGSIVSEGSGGKLGVRVGRKTSECIQWESDCPKLELEWNALTRWDAEDDDVKVGNFSSRDYWLYHDYKYMKEFLDDACLKKFCWSALGFPERDGRNSTLWIGTKGSYTPCHFDTYGCNLVCQVFGRKRWILFPPEDTDALRPTRVPYEESSVYSQINFLAPQQRYLQRLTQCSPLGVTLEPGDVLFVPPKWWHFVKAEDFSISVNTWVELPSDAKSRLDEAVIRAIIASVVSTASAESVPKILNPNESDVLDLNEDGIDNILKLSVAEASAYESGLNICRSSSTSKKRKTCNVRSDEGTFDQLLVGVEGALELDPFQFESITPAGQFPPPVRVGREPGAYLRQLVNSLAHPDVLKLISAQFLRNLRDDGL